MSVLAYSELFQRITGLNIRSIKDVMTLLEETKTTSLRLKVLKTLSHYDKVTISGLLKDSHMNRGGGTYLNIQKYFLLLEEKGLLVSEKSKTRVFWFFAPDFYDVKLYLMK